MTDLPLFLHFLDRELGDAAGFSLCAGDAEALIKTLLLGTTSRLYCGLSLLWEHPAAALTNLNLFRTLLEQDLLDVVSNHQTVDAFLASRMPLYAHDIDRYPMYKAPDQEWESVLRPTEFKTSSATTVLEGHLLEAATTTLPASPGLPPELGRRLASTVEEAVRTREGRAITYSLVASQLLEMDAPQTTAALVKRAISNEYCSHYMAFAGGDIVTGIRGLSPFDELARDFPYADVQVLSELLRLAGLDNMVRVPWSDHDGPWSAPCSWRNSATHAEVRRMTRLLTQIPLLASGAATAGSAAGGAQYGARLSTLAWLQGLDRGVRASPRQPPPSRPEQTLEIAASRLSALIDHVGTDRAMGDAVQRLIAESSPCDVLLVTATQIETRAILTRFGQQPGIHYARGPTVAVDLGSVGSARIYLVQSEMGSVGLGASQATVTAAINCLRPAAVIAVGMAFGVDRRRQTVGRVLVSRQLVLYEKQRVGTAADRTTDVTARGDRATASPGLLARFRMAANTCGCQVEFGLLLSGEKLIDNDDYRRQLLAAEPEAIGGEMEGSGVYAAASTSRVDWIVVKAICDWADGKKSYNKQARQERAATASADLVFRALTLGGFTRGNLRHGAY